MQYFFQLTRVYNNIQLISIHYSRVEKNWFFPNQQHPIFEFMHCTNGELEIKIDGINYLLNEGDSVIINPKAYHQMEAKENSVFFGFHFDINSPIHSIFQAITEPFLPSDLKDSVKNWLNKFLKDFENDFDQLHHLPGIPVQYSSQDSLKVLKMHSSFMEFIYMLGDYFYKETQIVNDYVLPSHYKVAHQVAYELNNTNLYNLQVKDIAQKLNIDRTHMTNCFKKVYNITPKQYLMQIRTQKAMQFLIETELTIEDIADKLMFSSPAHFTKYFIQKTSLSPSKFRTKNIF